MFIVGVAMPSSFSRRRASGAGQKEPFRHVLKRSFMLLLIVGVIGVVVGYALQLVTPIIKRSFVIISGV